jgi:hypothetical protein
VIGFFASAFSFYLIVANCRTKGHLQLLILVILIVCVNAIYRGDTALRSGNLLSPYLLAQGDDAGSRFYRLRGLAFINDPNDFAQLIVSLIPLLFFFWKKGNPLNYLFILPSIGYLIYGMYLTHSRGGMIALLGVLVFASRRKIGTIPAGIIAAAGFAAASAVDWSGGREVSVEAGAGRMEAWAVGIGLMKQYPLFGVGFNRFTEYFMVTAHNTVVVCAAELGTFGLFWWTMFVLPTIRDASVCAGSKVEAPKEEDLFSYDRAFATRRDQGPELRWREPQAATEPSGGVLIAEEPKVRTLPTPAHLEAEMEYPKLPPEEIQRIARLTLNCIVGYLIAGWFLSRAYVMILFIYGGMVQVIYRMALEQDLAPPRMKGTKVVKYAGLGAVGLIFIVYLMLRGQHLMPH